MRTRRDGRAGGAGWAGWAGWARHGQDAARGVAVLPFRAQSSALPAAPARPAPPALVAAQVPFEQATRDLASPDAGDAPARGADAEEAAYPEAAVPLARAGHRSADDVQLEAIAAELNIFLAEQIVPRKRVGARRRGAQRRCGGVGVFGRTAGARPAAGAGRGADRAAHGGARRQPARRRRSAVRVRRRSAVAAGRRGAARAAARRADPISRRSSASSDPAHALRGGARASAACSRSAPHDEPIEPTVGDAVITALNDNDRAVQGGGDAGARRDALRARRSGADRSVRVLRQGRRRRSGARRARAHRASVERAAVRRAAGGEERRAAAASRSKGWRGSATRRSWPAIQAALDERARATSVPLAGAFASVMLGERARPIRSPRRSRGRSCASRRAATWSSSRRAAPATFAHQLQDPDPRIRVDVVDALGLAGDPAALPLVEPLVAGPRSAGGARRRARRRAAA